VEIPEHLHNFDGLPLLLEKFFRC